MAGIYELKPNAGDSHQVVNRWICCVIPMKNRVTADPVKMASDSGGSALDRSLLSVDNPVEEDAMVIFDSHVIEWNTHSLKANHVSSYSSTILSVEDIRKKVLPGDWLFFWAFNNLTDYGRVNKLLKKMKNGTWGQSDGGCNGFNDGLKFVGRVSRCRRSRRVYGNSGKKMTKYELDANGYSEMDSYIYYNPVLAAAFSGDMVALQASYSGAVDDLILNVNKKTGGIDTQLAVSILFNIALGVGATNKTQIANQEAANLDSTVQSVNQELELTPNEQYLVPSTACKILLGTGSPNTVIKGNGRQPTYPDIIQKYVGIFDYKGAPAEDATKPWSVFDPGGKVTDINLIEAPIPLNGSYFIGTLDFNMRPVWELITSVLNEPVNEMYTALRVNPSGKVMPSLIVRQTPFSSNVTKDSNSYSTTKFYDLPRWNLSNKLVMSDDIGTTGTLRLNYFNVLAVHAEQPGGPMAEAVGLVYAPPNIDTVDIKRNGFRPMIRQTRNVIGAIVPDGGIYTRICSDAFSNGELKYNGTIVSHGIQEPICEGDNIQYENELYHIESVGHAGGIDIENGKARFTTTIGVSNGVSIPTSNDAGGSDYFKFPFENDTDAVTLGINKEVEQ